MSEKKGTFYITTPIYYPSARLHIGHAYCTVMADTVARYKRAQGYDVMFLTGTDEHGQKIEETARAQGVTPKEYVDDIVKGIRKLWDLMNISNDKFIRTTDDYHKKAIQIIFRRLFDRGDIYKGMYEGWYCTPCESFWTKSQLKDGKCPDCGREVALQQEEAYFFRLSKYADRLMELLDGDTGFLEPASRRHEMINNFLKPGLEDLCVSRTSFTWGIPVEFDPGHVVYVWVDALSNYITAQGAFSQDDSDFQKYWPADIHLVGKEIVRFHTIVWPAMLMALELPLPQKVLGHGWLTSNGQKMSKSMGNVIDPEFLCDRYGVDAIRYFLLREITFGQDGDFNGKSLVSRINSDLANDLGNLVSRTAAMVQKYFGGALPVERESGEVDGDLIELANGTKAKVEAALEQLNFSVALSELFRLCSRANKYIDETMPWVLARDQAQKPRLATVMYNLCECIRIIGILITPFMPSAGGQIKNIFDEKNGSPDIFEWDSAAVFGTLPKDMGIGKPKILFPRLDIDKELEALAAAMPAGDAVPPEKPKPQPKPQIEYDDFAKLELVAARVLECEKIKKSKKLLRLIVDDGRERRQIVSGIAQWYTPEQMIGKSVIIAANLKPVKLCGVESNGMILCSESDPDTVKVIFHGAEPGAVIR